MDTAAAVDSTLRVRVSRGRPSQSRLGPRCPDLLDLCRRASAERDLPALLDLLAREAARLLDAERASVFVLDAEKRELWSQVALGSEEVLRFDARLGIAGTVALTGEMVTVPDVRKDDRFYRGIDARTGYRTRNLLAAPLRASKGEVRGTFEVLNKRRGPFTEQDRAVLEALAAHAATAIDNARTVGDLSREREELRQQNDHLRRARGAGFATGRILGTSGAIRTILRLIEEIRDTTIDVLITGESGTGKELVARAVHESSPRAERPFVALNCAALPAELVESELFGIEKGVATGVQARPGKFEEAHQGTLFLDEIGDLSASAQAKILRAVQERVVERVGGRRRIPVDVRILAATNRDLEAEVGRGAFRADLYYRLNVVRIRTPPLREVAEDVPLLAGHFLALHCERLRRGGKRLSPGALRCLERHRWPGNVRELENEMLRVAATVRRKVVRPEDLSQGLREGRSGTESRSLGAAVAELEARLIREALRACRDNKRQAAAQLGLSRQGLLNKMKRYAIRRA